VFAKTGFAEKSKGGDVTENKEPSGFIAFRRNEGSHSFALISDRAALEKWKQQKSTDSDSNSGEPSEKKTADVKDQNELYRRVESLLDRFGRAMTSAHNMVGFTTVVGPAFSFLILQKELIPHAEKKLRLVEKDEVLSVYSFDRNQFIQTKKLVDKCIEAKEGYGSLPGATLLSLVASFDSYLSEILRSFLSIQPERYTKSEKQMSLKDIFSRSRPIDRSSNR
jgi:hypothetical protein